MARKKREGPTPRRLRELELLAEEARRLADEAPPLNRAQRAKLRQVGLDRVLRKMKGRGKLDVDESD